MDPDLLSLFQREVGQQARFGLIAAEQVDEALAEIQHPFGEGEWPDALAMRDAMDRFWAAAQSLLNAAANVSKLLWGVEQDAPAGRAELRASLDVADDSPLRLRTMRDHFEHFDKRLQDWGEEAHFVYVDRNIGPPESFGTGDTSGVLRNYDPAPQKITFRDEGYDLQPIKDELARLAKRAESESDLGW